ncbi:MAG TPA: class I SAM-dependent methyltransferase [Pirellulales bacterium]|nr:class I SAM-dependent methyltransferase [Pirellulales bacterium]
MTHPVRQAYDRLADEYDTRWRRYIDASVQLALEAVELQGRERVLDLGCGTGQLEARLLARWSQLQITGVDVSPNMLCKAAATRLPVRWLVGEAAALPLADARFDVVACLSAFHYFGQPRAALAEMRRVLRSQGQLIVVDWCDDYLTCKLCSAWLRLTDPAFYKTYSLAECQAEFERAGFQIISAARCRIGWLWGMMRLVCRAE